VKTSSENNSAALELSDVSIEIASDCCLIVCANTQKASLAIANNFIRYLTQYLVESAPLWLREYIPSYNSLLIEFDLDKTDHMAVKQDCQSYIAKMLELMKHDAAVSISNDATKNTANVSQANLHRIPVCYELDSDSSDLCRVAQSKNMTKDAVIKLHCSRSYQVYATGFLPGFAYLGELAIELTQPRLDVPRLKVPAGAVAIADQQTAIYPVESPGGWHILGFTPIALLSDELGIEPLLKTGDTVEFYPITQEAYSHWPEPCGDESSQPSGVD
jgi:KipI family sensor histidine kinase inhibitor